MRPANFSIDRKASATTPTILRDNLRHRKAFCKACFSILVEAKPTRCLSCTCRCHLSLCCIPSEVLMINSTDYLKVFSATPSDAEGHFARMRPKKAREMNLQQLLTFNFQLYSVFQSATSWQDYKSWEDEGHFVYWRISMQVSSIL